MQESFDPYEEFVTLYPKSTLTTYDKYMFVWFIWCSFVIGLFIGALM